MDGVAAFRASPIITEEHPDWKKLGKLSKSIPAELLMFIFKELLPERPDIRTSGHCFGVMALVCKRWRDIANDNAHWKLIFMGYPPPVYTTWAILSHNSAKYDQAEVDNWKSFTINRVEEVTTSEIPDVTNKSELKQRIVQTWADLPFMPVSQAQKYVADTVDKMAQYTEQVYGDGSAILACKEEGQYLQPIYDYLYHALPEFSDDALIRTFWGYVKLVDLELSMPENLSSILDSSSRITDDSIWDNLTSKQYQTLKSLCSKEFSDEESKVYNETLQAIEHRHREILEKPLADTP